MFENYEKIENADLKKFSTMKTGGKAKFLISPKNHLEIFEILEICKQNSLKFNVVGNGSNILFSDNGFDGVLISLKNFNRISILNLNKSKSKVCVRVGAGVNLFALNLKLQKEGLSGLEFSYGIPATLGGFLVMNGGCFGHEISEFVEEVVVIENSKLKKMTKEECMFSYRNSNLKDKIVLEAKLSLEIGNCDEILINMNNFFEKKRTSQPCDMPSLGSVFKRIEGEETIFPAKIIDEMGLKGFHIGDAEISKKHAGFIVNKGNATSSEISQLIEFLEKMFKSKGIQVEKEIIFL